MESSGIPHSDASLDILPKSFNISLSLISPILTCTETPSAPNLIASSTVPTRVLVFGNSLKLVDADKWTISPISLPSPL